MGNYPMLQGVLSRTLSVLLAGAGLACAQQYTISTVAGGAPPPTPGPATSVPLGPPLRVTVDSAGNLYFTSQNCVFRLDSSGTLTRVAGNSRAGFSGDGGAALNAQLNAPSGLAVDAAGDIFIADTGNNRVREVTPDGVMHTVAGNGQPGISGSLGYFVPATQAYLHSPTGVAVDGSGNLFIADTANNIIREVTPDGTISTIAGDELRGYNGDGGSPTDSTASLNAPEDVAVGSDGTIYIADTGNALVRAISGGVINFIAGNVMNSNGINISLPGFSGDGGLANRASLSAPSALVVDSSKNVYIVDAGNDRIRMITAKTQNINTIAGTGTVGFSGDGAAATTANLGTPSGIAVDSQGNLYLADSGNLRVRKFTVGGNINTVAGNGKVSYSGDGGPATAAQMNGPLGVGIDKGGNLYVSDSRNQVVRQVAKSGTISSIGSGSFVLPQGVAVDSAGDVFVADLQGNVVRRIGTDGSFTTFAGNGTQGYSGDGGPATGAELNAPIAVAVDSHDNVYIAEFSNSRIRKVAAADGTISTIAGNGNQGYSGDGGPAVEASLNGPRGIAVDAAGNVYIADTANSRIREVTPNGTISTIAGTGVPGFSGDGGSAVNTPIITPSGIAVDSFSSVYFIDGTTRVRRIFPNGTVYTIAGGSTQGYSGDGGVATQAQLNEPAALAVDASGNVYVADFGNNAVRLLQPAGSGITVSAVTNGASNLTGPVAPGEVVVLYGSGMGPNQLQTYQLDTNGRVPTNVAGTSVFFGGIAAPVLYTSATQVGAVVPFGITGSNVQAFVQYQNQTSAPTTLTVAPTMPGIFTLDSSGHGQAVAFAPNGQLDAPGKGVAAGSQLSLYATGLGQTSPPSADGVPGAVPPPTAALPVTVTIGGQPATVTFAGGAPGLVAGVAQINVTVPTGIQPGDAVPITLQVNNTPAQTGVTVAISN